jgi:tetratricopeptide (TPR) repeat protein
VEFQRFTAPDAAALEIDIRRTRDKLAAAIAAGASVGSVEHAADLGSMLTTARQEAEALLIMEEQLSLAESLPNEEATGWYWNSYATALQYLGRRKEADAYFSKALSFSQAGGWLRLQSYVLQHWGRSLVEQGRWDEAQANFSAALKIRQHLNDPRQASTQRALEGLARLRREAGPSGADDA